MNDKNKYEGVDPFTEIGYTFQEDFKKFTEAASKCIDAFKELMKDDDRLPE